MTALQGQPAANGCYRLRRPGWRKATAPTPQISDDGPGLLEALATSVAQLAPALLNSAIDARSTPATRDSSAGRSITRLWQVEIEGRCYYAALDSESQRTLLELILGGPGAATPTPVERTIVAECVERLLTRRSQVRWHERTVEALTHQKCWCCEVRIYGAPAASITLFLLTAAPPEIATRPKIAPSLDEVPLAFRAYLSASRTTLGALAEWRPGTLLKLDRTASELEAELQLARGPMVYGHLGCVNGSRGVRLNGSAAKNGNRAATSSPSNGSAFAKRAAT